MLKQDLKPDEDEHDATHDGGRLFVARAKGVADRYAGDGEDKGRDADERHGGHDVEGGGRAVCGAHCGDRQGDELYRGRVQYHKPAKLVSGGLAETRDALHGADAGRRSGVAEAE